MSVEIESDHKSLKNVFHEGKPMIKLGVTLSVGSIITLFVAYLIQVYITNVGGLTEVGYYNVGMIIINSYVGLIFESMSKDYFPRLSEIINDIKKCSKNGDTTDNGSGVVNYSCNYFIFNLCRIFYSNSLFESFSTSFIIYKYSNYGYFI